MAGGHGVDQRTVGHVDGGIADGQQQVSAECPRNLHAHAGFRYGEGQHADDANRECHPQLPGTKAPPSALGAVGNHAHDRVRNRVKYAQGNKQRADKRRGQAKNIGIEKGQKIHDQAGNDRAARVAQAVANFLANGQTIFSHPLCNVRLGNRCGSHEITPR